MSASIVSRVDFGGLHLLSREEAASTLERRPISTLERRRTGKGRADAISAYLGKTGGAVWNVPLAPVRHLSGASTAPART